MKSLFFAALLAALLPVRALADPVDATPAFDASVAAACASAENRTVKYPAGTFEFQTRPQPIPCALRIVGEGIGATYFIRRFSGGAFLQWVRGTDHSGGALRDLSIMAGGGTTGGIAVLISASADVSGLVNSYNRHNFLIENVIVGRDATGNSTYWDFGLYLDGSANPDDNPNSPAAGIRGVYVDKSTFGGAKTASIYLNKARGPDMKVECYTPILGGFPGVMMDNRTESVALQTRNCGWSIIDALSKGMILNGVRTGPQ